jgi:acetylornithine deacetylase/succinyl-diaminopimelate desuccinylase-like protein
VAAGLSPWKIVIEGEKMYGRGTADNKGQHTINIAAPACVLEERGQLGFNSTILIETGEETGSPGLAEFCKANKAALKADALIGSDGPAARPSPPCIFGGTRGTMNFNLKLSYREGGHHSGNWGGPAGQSRHRHGACAGHDHRRARPDQECRNGGPRR